jgi:hypothetical protein
MVTDPNQMNRPLREHDPRLAALINAPGTEGRRHYLSVLGEIPRCAREYMARLGIRHWTFRGGVTVELEIADGRVRFADVVFDAMPEPVVDEEFARCYSAEVKRFELRCPECRPGRVRFPWQFISRAFTPEGKDNPFGPRWLDPTRDDLLARRAE